MDGESSQPVSQSVDMSTCREVYVHLRGVQQLTQMQLFVFCFSSDLLPFFPPLRMIGIVQWLFAGRRTYSILHPAHHEIQLAQSV